MLRKLDSVLEGLAQALREHFQIKSCASLARRYVDNYTAQYHTVYTVGGGDSGFAPGRANTHKVLAVVGCFCWFLAAVVVGWFWLVLVGFGWVWLVLVGFGWFWLVLVGSGWFWLVLVGSGWLWLVLVGFGWFLLVLVGPGCF